MDSATCILGYDNGSLDSQVDIYVIGSGMELSITEKDAEEHFKAILHKLGKYYLGFSAEIVGTIQFYFCNDVEAKGK